MLKNQTKLRDLLFSPMDISLLVYFRIIFGTVMLWEVFRYFDHGWIYRYWIDPSFHFSYYGFSWVQPWPGDLMILHFVGLGILATCIMIGFKYRICAILFFLGFAHVFLSDQATYLNHFYLICWISFLMIFLPANRAFSIGALRNKKIKTDVIPGWPIWLLRAQLGIVYFFGGIAKINSDWLHGEPMRMWLAQRTDFPIIGGFFTDEFTVYSFSYGALLIDLLITPFLLYRKTRIPAFCIVTVFHVMNHFLFSIGIFPWFMIFATLLFFSPDWPRRFANFVSKNPNEKPKIASFVDPNKDTQHYLDRYYKEKKYKNWFDKRYPNSTIEEAVGVVKPKLESYNFKNIYSKQTQKIIIILFISFLVLQVALPLRHHFYPGDVNWTEEGHNFSWHMKLRDKDTYVIQFFVHDPKTGESGEFDPTAELSDRQLSKMSKRPDMIIQYAHHISDLFKQQGFEEIEVRVVSTVSLNGREPQHMVDPQINLVEQEITILPKSWILPLED